MMYMILTPVTSMSGQRAEYGAHTPYFTNDIGQVAHALEKDPDIMVYRVDGLTRVKNIKTTYTETL